MMAEDDVTEAGNGDGNGGNEGNGDTDHGNVSQLGECGMSNLNTIK